MKLVEHDKGRRKLKLIKNYFYILGLSDEIIFQKYKKF